MVTPESARQTLADVPAHVSARGQAGGLLVLLGLSGLLSFAGWLLSRRSGWLVAGVASSAIGALVVWIFRNPKRHSPQETQTVLAPADGQVTAVAQVADNDFLRGPATRIAIKVRPSDVQVSRAPLSGSVRLRRYEPGRSTPTSGADDSNWLGIRRRDGSRILLRQTASPFWRPWPYFLARRIICWPDLEDVVQAGQEIGHLPLGGQVEVYVPATWRLTVNPGQRICGGQDVIAQVAPWADE